MLLNVFLGILFLVRIFLNLATLERKEFLILMIVAEIVNIFLSSILLVKFLPKCKEVFSKIKRSLIMYFVFTLLSSFMSIIAHYDNEKCIIIFVLMLILSVYYGKDLYIKVDIPKKQVYSNIVKILPIHKHEPIMFSFEGDRARIIFINKDDYKKTTISVNRKKINKVSVKDETRIEKVKVFSIKENIFGQREEKIESIVINIFINEKSVE